MVAAHSNCTRKLAAGTGMKALPDDTKSYAHTQGLWRFLKNERVTPTELNEPLKAVAQEEAKTGCDRFVLCVHDWSRIKYAAFVRFQHRHQYFDDTARRIELAALLAFGQGEFAEEIFKDMTEHIGAAGFGIAERNIADQIDQSAKIGGIKVLPCIHFGQDAFWTLAIFFLLNLFRIPRSEAAEGHVTALTQT